MKAVAVAFSMACRQKLVEDPVGDDGPLAVLAGFRRVPAGARGGGRMPCSSWVIRC